MQQYGLLAGLLMGLACSPSMAAGGEAYSVYDENGDGYLDRSEYEVFRQGRPRRDRDTDILKFENVDADADDRISGDEMVQLLQRQLQEKLKAKHQ